MIDKPCIQGQQCNCIYNKGGQCVKDPIPEKICIGIVCMNMAN